MDSAKQRLIVFTRYPIPGRTKTRMIPALGAGGAAGLQREMTAYTVHTARALAAKTGVEVEIRFEGAPLPDLRGWLGRSYRFRPQGDGDLGRRMLRAFADAFAERQQRVVIVGTDCPTLDLATLERAFAALTHSDVVLGPASDGGYYLIGLNRSRPGLFEGIPWGTGEVLERTWDILRRDALRAERLRELSDVDLPEDLPIWEQARREASTLTVILPALNEAGEIETTLRAVRAGQPEEILVADGGSTDATAAIARDYGARVISSSRGRARQMNAGAAQASSAQVLFLHADTLPPRGYRDWIQNTLDQPAVSAGAFAFSIREAVPCRRWIERLVEARCRWLKTPFGDQGLFLRRSLFEAIGGFPDWPILEDVEIVRRLKECGEVRIERGAASTSGRRWLSRGVWKTFWVNQAVLLGHRCGVSLERLAKLYRSPGG